MPGTRYAFLVGLHVTDDAGYARYRQEMKPIMIRYGGQFEYDFVVDKTLASRAEHPINRAFVISFPDEQGRAMFFNDPAYKVVRETWFKPSVEGVTIIGSWPMSV